MRYFNRKVIMVILFLFCGGIVLFSGLIQFMMRNYSMAIFQVLVSLLFAFDAFIYSRPYLGLGEGKLIVRNSLLKKEILLLKDVTSINVKNDKLIITYSQGPSTMKLKILLSHLKKTDKEQFIKDLKIKTGNLGLSGDT